MIAIVDYKAGNLTSVKLALEHLGVDGVITRDPAVIENAERVIFPGDGAAASAMEHLNELGLVAPLKKVVDKGTPVLGICLGTQVICDHSDEDGGVDCMGLLPGRVKRFNPPDQLCKIPQMGWNTMRFKHKHPLFEGIEDDSEFYFIHSYYPVPADDAFIMGETEYADATFASAVGKGNLFATQFHPERSGRIGMRLLKNFTEWDGSC
ncbi:MAG: imidazole glycerol phosphate synthase subunit HisH [Candidatus Hydrogenedentes bacterium]|nr:imidazole glycerol phosphate synthase subunit HisH [Candidatus Hydrogenedentota bacterium]